ncbi:hypothetical protein HY639_02705 [Candidatus Woesearchaeota archaeon]|nr:hypothetical protein [Candidatus Woesearchaeota archaeon]
MENILWYAGIGMVLYFMVRWLSPGQGIDNELDEILTSDQYKVKGRFD